MASSAEFELSSEAEFIKIISDLMQLMSAEKLFLQSCHSCLLFIMI